MQVSLLLRFDRHMDAAVPHRDRTPCLFLLITVWDFKNNPDHPRHAAAQFVLGMSSQPARRMRVKTNAPPPQPRPRWRPG
jgi:hypothetical protein